MPAALTADADGPRGAAWDRFFFTPADPTPLGLLRIATGILLLWSFGCVGLDLRGFLGSDGWVDPDLLRFFVRESDHWDWSLWLAVPDRLLWPAWGLAMLVLLSFTLGFASRTTAVLAWGITVSTARRIPPALFGFDQMVSLWVFYLAVCGASGQALSLDRAIALRRGRWRRADLRDAPPPTVAANLGLRLVQVHLCLIYASAGLAKFQGRSWWDGSALIKLLANGEFRPFDLTWVFAWSGSEYLLNLATHVALYVEVLYPALVWPRATRRWMVLAALLMHAGIALTLGLTEFSAAMAAANLAFLDGGWLRRILAGRRKPLVDISS